MDPRRVILYTLVVTAVAVAVLTVPAWADGPGAGALSLFDVQDSHGIRVSQYELSIDRGGVTDPTKAILTMNLAMLWDLYRWWVGFLAYLLDWTLGMTWVTWLTGPLNNAATQIRSAILEPIGATGFGQAGAITLLLVIAGSVAAWHVFRGRSSGWVSMLSSALMAALAVGIFAAPVVVFAGNGVEAAKPLRYAQRIGVELGNAATTGKVSRSPVDSGEVKSDTNPRAVAGKAEVPTSAAGGILIDTFIRPVHQTLNYGASLDLDDKDCAETYDDALKAGPYGDDAKHARKAVAGCNKAYGKYADAPTNAWIFLLSAFWMAAGLLGAMILLFVVLLWFAVITLVWAAFRLMFTAIWAIPAGDSRGPLLRDLCDVLVSLIYVAVGTALLSVITALIKTVLKSNATVPILAQFVAVDFMLVVGIVLLIVNYIKHRRGSKTLFQKLAAKLGQNAAQPQLGSKAWDWLKQPSRGQVMANGQPSPLGAGAGMMGGRVTGSNGGQMVIKGAGLAAGVAAGVAAGGATAVARGAALTVRGASGAQNMHRTYGAVHHGAKRATTGKPRLDSVLAHTSRAHTYLNNQAGEARAAAASVPGHMRDAANVYSVTRHGTKNATTGNQQLDTALTRAGKIHNKVEQSGLGALTSATLALGPTSSPVQTHQHDGSWQQRPAIRSRQLTPTSPPKPATHETAGPRSGSTGLTRILSPKPATTAGTAKPTRPKPRPTKPRAGKPAVPTGPVITGQPLMKIVTAQAKKRQARKQGEPDG